MNKIVIVGNGFDLAHGLKTSYNDLMDFIKEDAALKTKKPGECGTIHYDEKNGYIAFQREKGSVLNYKFTTCSHADSVYFKELFTQHELYKRWVDLEALYFKLLKKHYQDVDKVSIINEEFDYLKKLLQKYLLEKVENVLPEYSRSLNQCLFEDREENKLLGIINFNYTIKPIRHHLDYLKKWKENFYHPSFLQVNIHGELNSSENPIIFGYGDDNSEEYKRIQNEDKEGLLKNFKTFQYLRIPNYHKVLALLEIEKDIKIEIIGHSCGLSDKTLLKTIFQHKNVKKIEYRYHESEDKYFENIYNISRVFDDNIMMREKLVSLSDTRIISVGKLM